MYVCIHIQRGGRVFTYIYAARGACGPFEALLHVSSYCYLEYIIYMCPHTTIYAARGPCGPLEVFLHMSPHSVCIYTCILLYVSSNCYKEKKIYIYLHPTVYVSSNCYKKNCVRRLPAAPCQDKKKVGSRMLTYADVY
jgi:hypothetical protein